MLFECSIPTIRTLRQKALLAYFLRLKRIQGPTQIFSSILINAFNNFNPLLHGFSTLLQDIRAAAETWNVDISRQDINTCTKLIKTYYKSQRLLVFSTDTSSNSLRTHRHNNNQPIYLINDPIQIMRARARMRFHRSSLNSHSFYPHIKLQLCPLCEISSDTIPHFITCTSLQEEYQDLYNTLQPLNIHPSHQLIIGNFDSVDKIHLEATREATATFIQQLLEKRRI